MLSGNCRLEAMDASPAPQWPGDGRHLRPVAVVANADGDAAGEIDALDVLKKPVHEMLPRLLAIGQDVDPGILLQLHHQYRGVTLRFCQGFAGELPRRPQHLRRGEPGRFRQAAGNRRFEHRDAPFLASSPPRCRDDRDQTGAEKVTPDVEIESETIPANNRAGAAPLVQ
jgi:hypothetical protein